METIAEKLLIKPNTTIWLSDPRQLPLLSPMPEGVREVDTLATASTAVVFADSADGVRERLQEHRGDLDKPGAFWVAYPKGDEADLNEDSLGPIVADFGLRPCGHVVIAERWTGLLIRSDQPGERHDAGDEE